MTDLTLFDYPKSSAAYRVRIALNLKELPAEQRFLNLLDGEHHGEEYLSLNPAGLVPSLKHDDALFSQSLAIIEYLDETFPQKPLLPSDPHGRAQVRALAQYIACEMHPILNVRILKALTEIAGLDQPGIKTWYAHWIKTGLTVFEATLAQKKCTGDFCYGDEPGLADACLAPQVFNALRWKCPIDEYTIINKIMANINAHPAFIAAHPKNQDFDPSAN